MMRPGGIELTVTPNFPTSRDSPFCPGMHRRLGSKRGIEPVGLRFAGYVDDAPPVALDHLRQERVGELALPGEVEGDRLFPLLFRRIEGQRPAASRAVDQDVDMA